MNLKGYFDLRSDLSSRAETVERITNGASFKGASLWILIFAIFIASLGLNVNSTAVIIGAMLISPLMGPIIAMGFAVGTRDLDLLRRAGRNYLVATGISIATATLYFLVTPYQDAQSELLARTAPTLYDVLIAFMGGAAGILALCIKDKGNVLPGVAIATALMPPLCTAGFGIASGNLNYFAGAFFLYFINTVFIALSTLLGVRLMKFKPHGFVDSKRETMVHRWIAGIVVATMIPAAIMTWNIMKQSYFKSQVNSYVHNQLNWEGTQVVTSNVGADSTLRVVVVGRALDNSAIAVARKSMRAYPALEAYRLKIIQGSVADSLRALNGLAGQLTAETESRMQLLEKQSLESDQLRVKLAGYENYEQLSRQLRSELKIFFPQVTGLNLASSLRVSTDSVPARREVLAVVEAHKALTADEKEKLQQWLGERVRLGAERKTADGDANVQELKVVLLFR